MTDTVGDYLPWKNNHRSRFPLAELWLAGPELTHRHTDTPTQLPVINKTLMSSRGQRCHMFVMNQRVIYWQLSLPIDAMGPSQCHLSLIIYSFFFSYNQILNNNNNIGVQRRVYVLGEESGYLMQTLYSIRHNWTFFSFFSPLYYYLNYLNW